ncbi:MAG: hypothetical protein VBE63_18310 [Lamprobacter sp.]|uniref:hypothetical protein n=1 Tax=Lamprobacter sp. TaxID=3100796 RepID=UPI002B25E4E9|nr:hypothetical protein [Lamprobacter sp.]MEA3641869.1 hypothetical protein [Lamprobacter sp.]
MNAPDRKALADQLARRIAERDTDTAEALIESAIEERPVFPREFPPGFEPDLVEFAAEQRQRGAIIQDGQRLARELHGLSQMLIDGDWTRLQMQREHLATVTAESAAALREFGA